MGGIGRSEIRARHAKEIEMIRQHWEEIRENDMNNFRFATSAAAAPLETSSCTFALMSGCLECSFPSFPPSLSLGSAEEQTSGNVSPSTLAPAVFLTAICSSANPRILLGEEREKVATLETAWRGVLEGTHDAEIKSSTQRLSTGERCRK